ncbi:hypothetical protein HPULCUR_008570 [Helicostylum pulchrum]|uniref:Transposase n=1 Tax=Helicostylum pulchrum TaxID=562976 RepID=A0ABP9Y8L2_9FUNG
MIASSETLLEFRRTLELLLAFKDHITKLAANSIKLYTRRNSVDDNFGRLKQPSSDNYDVNLWTRDTWYTPHRDNGCLSEIPDHLFRLSRPTSFLEKQYRS